MQKVKKVNNLFIIGLLVFGLIFLLNNLGVIAIGWDLLWPFIPLLYGLYLFYEFYKKRNKGLLTWATFLFGIGIFFLIDSISHELFTDSFPWWTFFPLIFGIGEFATYLTDKKDMKYLYSSIIAVTASLIFLMSDQEWSQSYLKYWPLVLIAMGVGLTILNKLLDKVR